MTTLTQDQQSNFARVFEGLACLVGDNESDAPRVLNALNVWRNDEDKTLLPCFLDKFGIPALEHSTFLKWVELKTQTV